VLVGAAHGTTAGIVTASGEVLAQVSAADAQYGSTNGDTALRLLDQALAQAGVRPTDLELAVLGLPGPSLFPAAGAPSLVGSHLRRFREWDGVPATEVVGAHLGCPVYAENDANLAALGETHRGAGDGAQNVVYVSLAHGTGAGLVLGGRLHRGRTRLAGEIGHLHRDDHGRLCDCGGRGCFWHSTSIPALLVELAQAHGRDFTTEDLAVAAAEQELDVVRALVGFGHALGRRLADAVVFLDPDAIVLDGSLREASQVVAAGVDDAIRRYAPPSMTHGLRVEAGTLGRTAHLVGASVLATTERLLAQS
jgi:predicted NBD/HSP70 family sugar kinase